MISSHARNVSLLAAIVTALAAQASGLRAQERKVELGTDVQLAYRRLTFDNGGLSDETASATQLQLPTGVRAGFFFSHQTSLELALTLNYVNPSDGDSFTSTTLMVGPMIHLSPVETQRQGYVRPFLGLNYVNAGESRSQPFFGGALGLKIPAGRQAATRMEFFVFHAPHNDSFPAETRIGANVGFSLFVP